ncbi:hypothetical protein C1Y40_04734 [Mycobacterium talmoniae]|nr:hypothetical protein C1Y40_04734 [Mycobacterium talmoniae]
MILLRTADTVAAATGLADALVALHAQHAGGDADLFHDEQIDGPVADRLRVLALTLAAERPVVAARIGGRTDVDLVGVQDAPDAPLASGGVGRAELQLAVLAVRLEMAAVYVRLMRG